MKVNLEQSCSLFVLGSWTLLFSLSCSRSSCRSTLLLHCRKWVHRCPLTRKLLILLCCFLLLFLSSCSGPCPLHSLLLCFAYRSFYLKRRHLPLKNKKVISIIFYCYLQLSFGKLRWKITRLHLVRDLLQLNAKLLISRMSWIGS